MGDLVLGLAKSVVEGTLTKAQSAIDEEAKLRQSVQSDLVFITGEFQMMQSFLNTTNEERVRNNVVRTWVRQVRDLAYDAEDCIDFVVYLDTKSTWWHRLLPPCMAAAAALPLDEAVDNIKQLRATVEDVSQRNTRYNLITDSGPKPVAQAEQHAGNSAAAFDMLVEARDIARRQRGLGDLTELITKKDGDLRLQVISIWGTGGSLGTTSIIRKTYGDPQVRKNFGYRGWAKMMHPFNPREFLGSLVAQFLHSDVNALTRMEEVDVSVTQGLLIRNFTEDLKKQRYLIVLEDLSDMVEWDTIRTYLPDMTNGSRIVVATRQFDIASLCTGHPYHISEIKQFSADHSVCIFFKEGCQRDRGNEDGEITAEDDRSHRDKRGGRLSPKMKAALTWKEFQPVGRKLEIDWLCAQIAASKHVMTSQVISVWGVAGVGKSALVRRVYYSEMLRDAENHALGFDMYGWVDVPHPFSLRDFSRSLLLDLCSEPLRAKDDGTGDFGTLAIEDPINECRRLVHEHQCILVIDGLRSAEEWDLIKAAIADGPSNSYIIVITDDASVAAHCSVYGHQVRNVKGLEADAALDLFKKEVFGKTETSDLFPDMIQQAEHILNKCGGLPKLISVVGRFLAQREKTAKEWRQMNDGFIQKLEAFPELDSQFAWMHSYFSTCPDQLKPCILYLSVFPGSRNIRRRRLVRRWIAESYSRDNDSSSAEENGELLFTKLVNLSIIQQTTMLDRDLATMRMVSCQVNGFFREYIVSRPIEENLVFALEGRCGRTTRGTTGRHLVIRSSWDRDKIVFKSIDFSRLRSLTVFGKWEPFFVSSRMKVLRVLDLEDASGVKDEDLEQIGELLPLLKLLSLRGCMGITRLPSSLGDLRQLQTLDVRSTSIATMPPAIAKLQKLEYLRAGTAVPLTSNDDTGVVASLPVPLPAAEDQPSRVTPSPWESKAARTLVSRLSEFRRRHRLAGADHVGVEMPRGTINLTALHTLGVIDVGSSTASGKAILKELENLTQLRKLGVCGINQKNSHEFCSAISALGYLESLSVRLEKDNHHGCLDTISVNPKALHSLKLYGHMDKLPVWIEQLGNLRKLNLEMAMLAREDMRIVGALRNLAILRVNLLQDGELHFPSFFGMYVRFLEIACSARLHVIFERWPLPCIEVLKVRCYTGSSLQFSGLGHLTGKLIKQVSLKGSYDDTLQQELQQQFDAVLKLE